ncbi:hypothetical protein [Streptomyces mirabilis]|uniref:hypothetical protein n=1 Tax=Streptomyces mirabilis TaxID=68239 RepID=UPI003811EE32
MRYFECYVCSDQSETKTCVRCTSRIRGALAALPEQFVWLTLSRQRAQGGGGDGRSSTRLHAPLPGREDTLNLLGPASRQSVTDARDQVGSVPFLETLAGWCEAVVYERGLTPIRRDLTAMIRLLTAHLSWICEQPWCPDFYEEIRDLLRTSQKITMTEPVRQMLKGVMCPSCSMASMVRYLPDVYAARCMNCDSIRLDEHDYRLLVERQVRDAQHAVNP